MPGCRHQDRRTRPACRRAWLGCPQADRRRGVPNVGGAWQIPDSHGDGGGSAGGRRMHEGRGMKFTVERDALAEAVTWVARALPDQAGAAGAHRAAAPRRAGQIRSAGSERTGASSLLSCFDYEVSARIRVRAEVAEPGTFLVPGRLLVEIVRSLPQHPVEFGDDPDGVSVTCGDAAFTLTPLPLGRVPRAAGAAAARRHGGRRRARRGDRPGDPGRQPRRHAADADRRQRRARRRRR